VEHVEEGDGVSDGEESTQRLFDTTDKAMANIPLMGRGRVGREARE
jgi:hypothetical protein